MHNNTSRWGELFLTVAVVFGAIVRFAPTALAGGIINDGGMFYTMIEEIKANGFRLPASTGYNGLGIPFAYPPLSLYAGALLSSLGISTGDVVRWLPPLLSSTAILAFYWMISRMLGSRSKAALATVAYALMPRSFSWYVMGGGLSRSAGILFLLLTCGSAWGLFEKPSWRRVGLTALFGAGAVMSHPETGLHTLAACVLIWLFRGRTRASLRDAAIVAAGVLVLSSPWWGSVIAQNGWTAVGSALHAGGHNGYFWTPLLSMDFGEERFVTVLTVLGLIGLAVQCLRREWFLPAWVVMPFLVEPRSATAIAVLPLAALAGIGLSDFLIPRLAKMQHPDSSEVSDWTAQIAASPAARAAVAYVLFFGFLGAFAYDLSLANYVVPVQSRAAMQWVKGNTPEGSRFVVLTGRSDPFSDPSEEWFPTLTERTSVNTIQGREWTLGSAFIPFRDDLQRLETCLNGGPDCVEDWARRHDAAFDYLFIEKPPEKDAAAPSGLLIYELRSDVGYSVAFENAGVVVFEKK